MRSTPSQRGHVAIVDLASRHWNTFFLAVCWCALLTGCGSGDKEEEQSNLRSLAAFYNQYRANHRGLLPADEKDFKNFISKSASSNVDSLFISNRDGKPYVIKYRGDKSWVHPEVIAYEQEGRDESREVATVVGGYEKWSEEQFQQQMTGAAAKR